MAEPQEDPLQLDVQPQPEVQPQPDVQPQPTQRRQAVLQEGVNYRLQPYKQLKGKLLISDGLSSKPGYQKHTLF